MYRLNGLGAINLSNCSWRDFDWLAEVLPSDGWEILAIKVYPEGVYMFIKQVIKEFLEDDQENIKV